LGNNNTIYWDGSRYCKLCKRSHDSNGAKYSINEVDIVYWCLADTKSYAVEMWNPNTKEVKSSLLEKICTTTNPDLHLTISNPTMKFCSKYVNQAIKWRHELWENNNIVIHSALGTGKSQFVSEILSNFKYVIYISNWWTLSQNIATRFGFASYEDIEDRVIDLDIHGPRVVCQIDSL